ncbi:MAG: DEAD/DEAH box helicase [Bacteroidales bacterium]|nr:DEAD/DEAH box helicase [Bacteroidales bacterium]MCB9000277.1 DEAD/DEAH box helicase [Bacteroidales bacterium]MCB9012879.1 DEAD/DEAH box helicase [Bacteroidales bacterium]
MLTFKETGIREELLKAVEELGFDQPTPIQEKTIPALLNNGGDIIALAQTGTGKTAAFGLPLIHLANIESKKVEALVLCPTRELCIQITKDLDNYSKYLKGFRCTAVYGGADISKQIRALKDGCQIVVATPGRAIDLIKRKALKINDIKWLVLDEADEMLNMGFKEDLETIMAETSTEKQTLLFSATMPREIAFMAKKYMNSPQEISVGKKNSGAENVEHEYYMVHAKDRYAALKRIVDFNPNVYGIVFCRTRMETKEIAEKLIADGYPADSLHGDLSQAQRDHVMNRFRLRQLQLLVATDVAARGLDVNDLSHIINYNLPDELEVYIHRSGRTGRASKNGTSIAIVHTRENRKIQDLERLIGKKFTKKPVPVGTDICEKQLFNLIDKFENVEVDEKRIEQYLPLIYKKLEWLDRDNLIKRLVSLEFNRFLEYYKNAPDLNVQHSDRDSEGRGGRSFGRESREGRRGRSSDSYQEVRKSRFHEDFQEDTRKIKGGFSRFFINVGSRDNLNPGKMITLINEQTRKRNIEIGKIDILKSFSFFEVDVEFEKDVIKSFKNAQFNDIPLQVELSKPDVKKKDDWDRPKKNKGKKKSGSKFERR